MMTTSLGSLLMNIMCFYACFAEGFSAAAPLFSVAGFGRSRKGSLSFGSGRFRQLSPEDREFPPHAASMVAA